jgi:hypothetical protein
MKRSEFKRFSASVSLVLGVAVAGGFAYLSPSDWLPAFLLGAGMWLISGVGFWFSYLDSHRWGEWQNSDASWPTAEEAERQRRAKADARFLQFLWPFAKREK